MNAVHATPAAARNWHNPNATRGRPTDRARSAPALLPIPNPTRNTARITEKVYTVAPIMVASSLVQTTSAPSALMPENPITRYTVLASAARAGDEVGAASFALYSADRASRSAIPPTAALMNTAAYVVNAMS